MASRTSFEWNGDKLIERLEQAATESVDEVLQECAADAEASHWWLARKGDDGLEGQIITEAASSDGTSISGRFGTTQRSNGFYGLFLEYRTPFLRPAADRHFPTLPSRIRGKFSR